LKNLEFELKTGSQGHVYLPKRIREAFGQKLKFLPNTYAAAVFPEDADPEAVISSLQVIISDLQLRAKKRSP
jgi:bifunctional DNA-binding transcriptional regulator/antitoxin component of YhaV-PrlF toxin-antitoxin module